MIQKLYVSKFKKKTQKQIKKQESKCREEDLHRSSTSGLLDTCHKDCVREKGKDIQHLSGGAFANKRKNNEKRTSHAVYIIISW